MTPPPQVRNLCLWLPIGCPGPSSLRTYAYTYAYAYGWLPIGCPGPSSSRTYAYAYGCPLGVPGPSRYGPMPMPMAAHWVSRALLVTNLCLCLCLWLPIECPRPSSLRTYAYALRTYAYAYAYAHGCPWCELAYADGFPLGVLGLPRYEPMPIPMPMPMGSHWVSRALLDTNLCLCLCLWLPIGCPRHPSLRTYAYTYAHTRAREPACRCELQISFLMFGVDASIICSEGVFVLYLQAGKSMTDYALSHP